MLRLSALALGPLIARAVPRTGSGIVDDWSAISQWLSKRYSDPHQTFAKATTKAVERAWRSLEIALAGEILVRRASDSATDPALIAQLRQFLAVVELPTATHEFHNRVSVELQKARQASIVPGPLPTSDELATAMVPYRDGPSEDAASADAKQLADLAREFRTAGYASIAEYVEARSMREQPILIVAVRYFLSREIAEDPRLLRDLRFTRLELLPDSVKAGFDRLSDALDRFGSVIATLVAQETLPELSSVGFRTTVTPGIETAAAHLGFSILGPHLVAPIRTAAEGARFAPCPVCLSLAELPRSVGSWITLRCHWCGIEFRATDGRAPPPALPSKTTASPELAPRGVLSRNLKLWVDSGEPSRWIEYRKGTWGESDFKSLCDRLQLSRFWPLDPSEIRKVLTDLTEKRPTEGRSWSFPAPRSTPSATPAGSAGPVRTSDVYRTIDGNLWVPCPLCRSFNVEIPPRSPAEVTLTCSGCSRSFIVELKKRGASLAILPPPPVPSPTLWKKVRKWFGAE